MATKVVGWLIILGLVGCLLGFAFFMPTPKFVVPVTSVIGGFVGPAMTEPVMQWFGMFVAAPLTIIACYLLDHGN